MSVDQVPYSVSCSDFDNVIKKKKCCQNVLLLCTSSNKRALLELLDSGSLSHNKLSKTTNKFLQTFRPFAKRHEPKKQNKLKNLQKTKKVEARKRFVFL